MDYLDLSPLLAKRHLGSSSKRIRLRVEEQRRIYRRWCWFKLSMYVGIVLHTMTGDFL